ncbi:MAG: APC family permease [Leucobacter sp.]
MTATETTEPHLKRTLGLIGLTLFGLTYMTAITVFTTYGFANLASDGHLPASYIAAAVAMIFTALSYAAMVRKYPVAGSAYTYTQQSFGGAVGFLTGWAMLLDYLFIPMINFMVIGTYMQSRFPEVPWQVFMLIALFGVFALNAFGIKLINRVNAIIITVSVVMVVMFVVLSLQSAGGEEGAATALEPFQGELGPVFAGAAILALSFLGFDAISTLSEEAKNARRDIPRAIVLATLLGGLIFIIVSWAGAMAYSPDWGAMSEEELDAAGVGAMLSVGGEWFANFGVAVYVAGAFGSGLTGSTSVSRILYSMGRDGALPKPFARIWTKYGTPIVAAAVVSGFALLGLVIPLLTVSTMISFGALAAFSLVNLSVIRTYLFPKGGRTSPPTVGEWLRYGLMPVIGFLLTGWLWTSLSGATFMYGGIWLVLGVLVLAWSTKGFRRPAPKMDFKEEAPSTENIDALGTDHPASR